MSIMFLRTALRLWTIRPRSAAHVRRGVLVASVVLAALPGSAAAHGPVAPVATSYLARVSSVPAGIEAKVIDGYVRMWLRVPPSLTVVILDYNRAPYLRFSRSGVQVNLNSTMYYLNQTPVAETPPADLRPSTPPHWQSVSTGHDYEWHDGRLQALAAVALTPGTSYLGRWSVPLLLDGRRGAVTGGLWHADDPPLVWFWPIVVLLACVLASRRVRRPWLDGLVARLLAVAAVAAVAVAAIGRGLHGRPTVSIIQLIELGFVLSLVGWALFHVLTVRAGYFAYFVIAFVAVWEGLNLLPTLLHRYVLLALPAFLARGATVLCLGAGAGLLLLISRLADQSEARTRQLGPAAPATPGLDPLEEAYDAD
jgi:hypothetical protein